MVSFASLRPDRDVHAGLLDRGLALKPEQRAARASWVAALSEGQRDALRDLEVLLGGIVCFGDPRHHAGDPGEARADVEGRKAELRTLRDAARQVAALASLTLGAASTADTAAAPHPLAAGSDGRDHPPPEEGPAPELARLGSAFARFADLAAGLEDVPDLSLDVLTSIHGLAAREVARSGHFGAEGEGVFRSEVDRITHPEVLGLLRQVESDAARRVIGWTFLTLFRALRHVHHLERDLLREECGMAPFAVLAMLRRDLERLAFDLPRLGGPLVMTECTRRAMAVPAHEVAARFDGLAASARGLSRTLGTLNDLVRSLHRETMRLFTRAFPSPRQGFLDPECIAAFAPVVAQVRACIEGALEAVCAELRPGEPPPDLGRDWSGRRAALERTRLEAWMVQQILRAFISKADAALEGDATECDAWTRPSRFGFVRDFLEHHALLGRRLARTRGYPRLDALSASLEPLRDADLVPATCVAQAAVEGRRFLRFLDEDFQRISARPELTGLAFDRALGARALAAHLGRG
jgi:hypothetical protein